jgi:hypothetical protein
VKRGHPLIGTVCAGLAVGSDLPWWRLTLALVFSALCFAVPRMGS